LGIQTTRKKDKKMSQGFNVEIEMPKSDIDKLLRRYKKIKKYQKSSLYAIKTIDGTEEIVSSLIKEAEENPL
jgi:DNA integrity scanning protein DisA with diadenylate cyclase activity